jgi:tetratricopeptide (TPR) repeat protein
MGPITIARYAYKLVTWLTPHVQRAAENFGANAREADRFFELKKYREAAHHYAACMKEADQRRYPARKKLQIQLRLAESLRRSGDKDKALEVGKDALTRAVTMGEKDLFHGSALESLSMTHEDRGDHAEALALARRALAATQTEGQFATLAGRASRLAKLEREAGDIEKSKQLLTASIDSYRRAHGANHPGTATQLAAMATMLQEEGQLSEALPLFEKAFEVHRQLLGASARETMSDLEHIGQIQYMQKDLKAAVESYARLARFKENEIGGQPVEHARFLVDAATVHEAAGEMGKALEFLMQANQKGGRDAELVPIVTERMARLRRCI